MFLGSFELQDSAKLCVASNADVLCIILDFCKYISAILFETVLKRSHRQVEKGRVNFTLNLMPGSSFSLF